jgi:hypothetical protein
LSKVATDIFQRFAAYVEKADEAKLKVQGDHMKQIAQNVAQHTLATLSSHPPEKQAIPGSNPARV